MQEIKDQLGYVPHKLTDAGINVEALRPDLGNLVNWVGGNVAEAREILDDIIEELKLEENIND